MAVSVLEHIHELYKTNTTYRWLREEVLANQKESVVTSPSASISSLKTMCFSLWEKFDEKVKSKLAHSSTNSNSVEVKHFHEMHNVTQKTNLVAWWMGDGKSSFPSLYHVAMKYLSVQGSGW